jgi:peptidoglycan/xylan/chitin deacetylase (PgdA/CDA1 family)
MANSPGKLLPLVAALLCGAVLAQAATPKDQTHASSSAPVVLASAASGSSGGRLSSPITRKQGPTSGPKKPADRPVKPAAPVASTTAVPDWNLTAHGKVLFLTFDDGPQAEYTPQILRVLRKHHAYATFFVIGIQVAQFPELVTAERAAGHHVGNHTLDHKTLTHLPDAKVRQEIGLGIKSNCLRPPEGATSAKIQAIAASYHQRQVLWDVDTEDWEKPGTAHVEHSIMSGARPGAIILMHDGGGNRSQTVTALDHALTKLAKQGYIFRSLPC